MYAKTDSKKGTAPMNPRTIDDLRIFSDRLIDFQVASPPVETWPRRGRVLKVSCFSDGPIIYITDLAAYDETSRAWHSLTPSESELDLRSIEGRAIYLPPVQLPDGTVELVLLDGRSAVVHPLGAAFSAKPLVVSFSFSDFLAIVC